MTGGGLTDRREGLTEFLDPEVTGFTDVSLKRESARQTVAIIVAVTILAVVICSFITLWTFSARSVTDLKVLLDILFAPIIGIFGAVVGFYFGANSASGKQP